MGREPLALGKIDFTFLRHTETLGLFIPETELFLRNIVGEMVTLAAALNATLVAGALAHAVPGAAVLQQTWIPLQTKAVCAQTGLPHIFSRVTSLEAGRLCCLGQHLKYRAIHSCNTKQGEEERYYLNPWQQKQKQAITELHKSFSNFAQFKYFIESKWLNKKEERWYSKKGALLCRSKAHVIPSADNGADGLVNHRPSALFPLQ